MKIARVFPRKTKATPDDPYAFYGSPPIMFGHDIDEVHISVAFTYDIEKAHRLADQWEGIAPVKIGGPAVGDPGGEFIPGMYIKKGITITSRGCPNRCWFCDVWKREGSIRELDIKSGHIIQDSNLLACSEEHIRSVFEMLKDQEKVQFTGGLEAARLKWWHVDLLWELRPDQIFFSYDTKDDLEPLIESSKMMRIADFTRRHLRCYVLIGYPDDTLDKAEKRLMQTWNAGFMPMAMLYRDKKGNTDPDWRKLQRIWARPALIRREMRSWVKKKSFK